MVLLLKKIFKPQSLSSELQLRFLKRLSRLLLSGYALMEALEVIMWDKDLRLLAKQMQQSFIHGSTVDEAFEKAGFHPSIISHLYVIRMNGDLDSSIHKCIEMFEQRHQYLKKFQQVIRYPLLLTFIFVILLYSLQRLIFPVFIDLFQMNLESIAIVQVALFVLNILGKTFIIGLVVCLLLLLLWLRYQSRYSIAIKIKWYEKVPLYRRYLKIHTTFQLATHISSSLKSGLPFKDILAHLTKQKQLPIVAYYAELMIRELNQGLHLEPLMLELPFLEEQMAIIFQKNNNMHMLQQDLAIYADWLIEDLQQKVMKMFEMIQPIFFTVLAILIILMYIMLMWPMFDMMQMI